MRHAHRTRRYGARVPDGGRGRRGRAVEQWQRTELGVRGGW